MRVHIPDLDAHLDAAGLTLDELVVAAKLSPTVAAEIARGQVVKVSDGAGKKLAAALKMTQAEVKASRGGDGEGDEDGSSGDYPDEVPTYDGDAVYDESAPRMAEGRGRAGDAAPREVDWETALEVALRAGDFTRDDGQLVLDTLGGGAAPQGVHQREAPAFLRAWLQAARELREDGVDGEPAQLVARVADCADPVASKAARRMRASAEESARAIAKVQAAVEAQRAARQRKGRPVDGDEIVMDDAE